jgi:hypothetical protein
VGLGHALVATWLSKNYDNQGKSLLKPDKKNFKVVRSRLFYCSLPSNKCNALNWASRMVSKGKQWQCMGGCSKQGRTNGNMRVNLFMLYSLLKFSLILQTCLSFYKALWSTLSISSNLLSLRISMWIPFALLKPFYIFTKFYKSPSLSMKLFVSLHWWSHNLSLQYWLITSTMMPYKNIFTFVVHF